MTHLQRIEKLYAWAMAVAVRQWNSSPIPLDASALQGAVASLFNAAQQEGLLREPKETPEIK